jgi:hypothetical protein
MTRVGTSADTRVEARVAPGGGALTVTGAGVELFRYVHQPRDPQVESPRPYLHPVRTLDGDVVTVYRPDDHVWHKGVSFALPNLGEANFWGGVTFRRGLGYVQLPNNGSVRHVAFDRVGAGGGESARIDERLRWVTEPGDTWLEESRSLAASLLPAERAWVLSFRTALVNVAGEALRIGSPTTEGRPLAGYGGLFWRGPRSFTGGEIVAPDGGGEAMMGRRAPWLAFVGRHDEVDRASTVAFVDHPGNPGHPTEWFTRADPFACICPAPFFSAELALPAGGELALRYDVVVAAGAWDRGRIARVVDELVLPGDRLPGGRAAP